MINFTEAFELCELYGLKLISYCAARGYDFAPCSNGRTMLEKKDVIRWIVWEN